MHPDRTDFEILRLLRKNARIPNKDLAARVGVAPSTALERVRRLREAGVLLGYHAEIAPAAVGIGLQAMVDVRLARHSRADVERAAGDLRFPCILKPPVKTPAWERRTKE